jgi:L-methionine (R)-S-oxide reductase
MAEEARIAETTGEPRLSAGEKHERYARVADPPESLLAGEAELPACMSSIASVLHHAFPYFIRTGFSRRIAAAELPAGPYQGTAGCLRIPFDRGVCGAAATQKRTIIVPNVDLFPGHIPCDARSRSEIVVPVFGRDGELTVVLDVGSTVEGAFDEADRVGPERIGACLADRQDEVVWRSAQSAGTT